MWGGGGGGVQWSIEIGKTLQKQGSASQLRQSLSPHNPHPPPGEQNKDKPYLFLMKYQEGNAAALR